MITKHHVRIYAVSDLPTKYGQFKLYVFHNDTDQKEHLAIVKGDVAGKSNVPVRIHSECLTGEVLGSLKCDCGEQLEWALHYIANQECGAVLYLRQEGRGIGLGNKIRAYALQEEGFDTVEANHQLGFPDDLRQYGFSAEMLQQLGIISIKLLTNNPEKIRSLELRGIPIIERIPVLIKPTIYNQEYLKTKMEKSGHLLDADILSKPIKPPVNGKIHIKDEK